MAALVPAVAAESNPDDPKAVAVEKEFRELLKLDDRLHAEVDRWIRDNAALTEANAAIFGILGERSRSAAKSGRGVRVVRRRTRNISRHGWRSEAITAGSAMPTRRPVG